MVDRNPTIAAASSIVEKQQQAAAASEEEESQHSADAKKNEQQQRQQQTLHKKNYTVQSYLLYGIVASVIFQLSIGPYLKLMIYGPDDIEGFAKIQVKPQNIYSPWSTDGSPPPHHKFRPIPASSPAFPYCLRWMNRLQQQQGWSGAAIDQSSSSMTMTTATSNNEMRCYEPTEMRGRWHVRKPNDPSLAAPICCGWDPGVGYYRNDPERCGTMDVDSHNYTGRDDGYYQQTGANACTCRSNERNFDEKWIWKFDEYHDYEYEEYTDYHHKQKQRHKMRKKNDDIPSSAFQIFNPHLTCSLLGTKKVLMIGDSTMQQTASTLMNSLLAGNCSNQISFLIIENYETQFVTVVASTQPNIVIYSMGAHFRQEDVWQDLFDKIIDNVTISLQNQYPNMMFVYKTHQSGGCTTKPNLIDIPDIQANKFINLIRGQQKEKEIRPLVPGIDIQYHNYGTFYGRDLYAMGRLWDRPVLDVRMLHNRGDGHINENDCLHFCSPGPLDVIPLLFQRLLLKSTQTKRN